MLVSLACDGGSAKTTVTGTFVLTDSDTALAGCVGQGGYSDMSPGVAVTYIHDHLDQPGQQDSRFDKSRRGFPRCSAGTCTHSLTIPDVPKDQGQYAIEVSHRGKGVQSKAEMVASGWKFELSMG